MVPTKIIWHHSADTSTGDQFEKINAYHKRKRFPKSSLGFYVGYHWLIENDGKLVKCRNEDEPGSHDIGENFRSIGICLAGDFSFRTPTKTQEKTVGKLVGKIMKRWSIPIERIEPHRWNDTTECPGKYLNDDWLIWIYIKYELNFIRKWIQRLKLMFK